jgi:hypothetical protein
MSEHTATPPAPEPEPAPTFDESTADETTVRLSKKRRLAIWTLIILASVLCFASILTTWVQRQMLNNDAWQRATTQVIQDPAVQTALSTYLVNQLYSNVDVGAAIGQRLPKNLQHLGPTIAGALQAPAERGVVVLLQRPRIQQSFIKASALAHEKLVNVLENKTGKGISTGNGVVTLNLHVMLTQLADTLGLPGAVVQRIPESAGTVTLLKSDQLKAAQNGVSAIRTLSAWLFVAVFAMYAVAIYIARGARRPVLRNIGWAIVIIGLLVLVVRRLLGNYLVDALASPGYSVSTHHLYLIGTSILGQIGQAAILYGAVATAGAILAGPSSIAVSIRRWLAPTLEGRPGVVAGAVGFLYLLLVLWGPTHALRTWWGILLLGGLVALGVVAFRRQTLREFPAGSREPKPPLAERLTAARRPTTAAATAEPTSRAQDLALLRELHDSGALTDEEYARSKAQVLT